jgi:uncharacterized protein (DUF1800 family)
MEAALAPHRFGTGAGPGDLNRLTSDPKDALRRQLRAPEQALLRDAELPSSAAALVALASARAEKAETRVASEAAPPKPMTESVGITAALTSGDPNLVRRTIYRAEVAARLRHGATTEVGFLERLVLFWSNHFAVSAAKGNVRVLAGALEREAIRPHVAGRFADMLKAVGQHPAMLIFLDNQSSVGPNSNAGQESGKGLNENLAREVLELHTLGSDGGYTQEDVTSFAKVLTGWSLRSPNSGKPDAGNFAFFPERHEPGDVTLFGRTYPAGGVEQGEAVLADLAGHRATARHLARKLASHFIADDPPQGAVRRLEVAFLDSNGDLKAVSEALVACPEAWDPKPQKVKTPYEFVLSAIRLRPELLDDEMLLTQAFSALGQRPFEPPSPKGWPDEASAWLAPHSFKQRLDWATLVSERHPPSENPVDLADATFGPLLSNGTRQEIARADSAAQGLALLLMSPEFQRR